MSADQVPLNEQSASWTAWCERMRAAGRIIPDGAGGEWVLGVDGRVVGGISTATFRDLNAPKETDMSDELDLKLGRLATNLASDLSELDNVHFGRDCHDQKVALIIEALGEAIRLERLSRPCAHCSQTFDSYTAWRNHPCMVSAFGRLPDSLRDHGA